MNRLGNQRGGLARSIGQALNNNPPPWESLQPQTQELAKLAASLSGNTPSKGSPESWSKLTSAFASSASELDKAVQAKDKNAALAANQQVQNSCNTCHQQHRSMRGPGGGMGMPPGGGGPPGGGRGRGR